MSVCELRRLRELERENSRLKRLLAERNLEVEVLSGIADHDLGTSPAAPALWLLASIGCYAGAA